jgi:hypothetical protein
MDTCLHTDGKILISPYRYEYERIKVRSAGLTRAGRTHARTAMRSALPQHGRAAGCVRLGVLRGVGELHRVARVLADERTRPCTARAGPADTRSALASMRSQPAQGRRIGGGLERNRAPLDAEGGVPVSAATDESDTTSLASLAPTAPRKAWHLANSASQLVTPDASWGVIWARHMTPNVTSTTRIAVRLLQRTRDGCVATIASPLIRDRACSVHRTEDGDGGLKAMTTRAAYG